MKIWSKSQLEFLKINRELIDEVVEYSEWFEAWQNRKLVSNNLLFYEKAAINLAMALKLNGAGNLYFELTPIFSRWIKGISKGRRKDFKEEFFGVGKQIKVYSPPMGRDYDVSSTEEGESHIEYPSNSEKLHNLEDLYDEKLVRDFLIDEVLDILNAVDPRNISYYELELYFLRDLKIKIEIKKIKIK